jgi:GNAT superfamily N-acetyltransferase
MLHHQEKQRPASDIVEATTGVALDHARFLMRAFVDWHRTRHAEDSHLIDRYFDRHAFDAELAGLPGSYAPPHGALLVAYHDGAPAGCVALRNLGLGIAEMKRMFVAEEFRGLGIGHDLAARIIAMAATAGYRAMRLDTGRYQSEAMGLYESMGFHRIPPYAKLPRELEEWLVFYERDL